MLIASHTIATGMSPCLDFTTCTWSPPHQRCTSRCHQLQTSVSLHHPSALPGAQTAVWRPCRAPTCPHSFYFASSPHPTLPFCPTASCPVAILATKPQRRHLLPRSPSMGERNMAAAAPLRERRHGRGCSEERCMSNIRERERKRAN